MSQTLSRHCTLEPLVVSLEESCALSLALIWGLFYHEDPLLPLSVLELLLPEFHAVFCLVYMDYMLMLLPERLWCGR